MRLMIPMTAGVAASKVRPLQPQRRGAGQVEGARLGQAHAVILAPRHRGRTHPCRPGCLGRSTQARSAWTAGHDEDMATPTTAPIRRWIVRTTIGSFSLAALLGIVALLGGGEFGETEGQILLTTLLVGVVSIAVLCYLATAGRRSQPLGIAGGVSVSCRSWPDWS